VLTAIKLLHTLIWAFLAGSILAAAGTAKLGDHVTGSGALQSQLNGGAQNDCAKDSPARQVVKCAPWMIERAHLELSAVRKEIRRVHEGRRPPNIVHSSQGGLFADFAEGTK
jgi:hypothetical protein